MRLGLIGDIHGNSRALSAVVSAAKSLNVERLLVTGDLVGYYFDSFGVLEELRFWKKDVVRGNHEQMLREAQADFARFSSIDARYGSALRMTAEQLDEGQLDELCNLPHPLELDIEGRRILLCHGSPWNLDEYVYPDAPRELFERCALSGFDLVVMGHTHYPMSLRIGKTLVVNPGSVGQPRNRKPGAHWVMYDTLSDELEHRVEFYDVGPLIQECRERCPELPYLSDVLART